MVEQVRYRIGIDVGTHSVGFAAIELDGSGRPLRILNAMVLQHDSGIDPDSNDSATTRLALSGVARRTRRLYKRRKQRLADLDRFIREQGWPIIENSEHDDPHYPWRVRAQLANERIDNTAERNAMLSVAFRHMARHRGWRNPYASISTLQVEAEPSNEMRDIISRCAELTGHSFNSNATQAELIVATALPYGKVVRGVHGILGAKLMQSDNANEIRRIAKMQDLDSRLRREIISYVFKAESPRGSAVERIGRDPLPGQGHLLRASRASLEFQRYKIADVIGNLRIRPIGSVEARRLSVVERRIVFDYLTGVGAAEDPTWSDVAAKIGVDREELRGTAALTSDGEQVSRRPPIDTTNRRILECKLTWLKEFWVSASWEVREALIEQMGNGPGADPDTHAGAEVQQFCESLTDEQQLALENNVKVPKGRAAYSIDSMQRISSRILNSEADLFQARQVEFAVPDQWQPPADLIGQRVGNPAVDRVTKAVARWLFAAEREWGGPERVVIEHVRTGFVSEQASRELTRENDRRRQQKLKLLEEMVQSLGAEGPCTMSDLVRYQAVMRQNGQCGYCGTSIDYASMQLDHIVPRRSAGSSSRQENLMAVCSRCNLAKSNKVFSMWAQTCGIDGVSLADAVERVHFWQNVRSLPKRDWESFKKEVISRLQRRTEDPEIDDRSMASVAWMANELRHRIEAYFASRTSGLRTEVVVYRGALTGHARAASGLEKQIHFIGGPGKTRLDRRHHAVDAAVLTLMEPSIVQTLVQRMHLRDEQRLTRSQETWKSFGGTGQAAHAYGAWRQSMQELADLINTHIEQDRIPIVENLRLRVGDGAAHDARIRKLTWKSVGAQMSAMEIDRASTPALWTALTKHPDFDPGAGLPENADRTIRIKGRLIRADQTISIFGSDAAAIAVRGGYADIGGTIHHARVYRLPGRKATYGMVRVFASDLVRATKQDLFSFGLPPSAISIRTASPNVRKSILEGTAEYLGWLVKGDELMMRMDDFQNGGLIGQLLEVYPGICRWRIGGFPDAGRIRLRPSLLSPEGLAEDPQHAVRVILKEKGWIVSLNVACGKGRPTVIRRDSLGRVRVSSAAGLPISWSIR